MRVKTGVFQSAKNAVRPIFLLKLPRRHVDADGNGRTACILPFLILAACLMQNPVSKGHDEPGFLRQRDELDWRYHAECWVFRTDKGFHGKNRPDFKST